MCLCVVQCVCEFGLNDTIGQGGGDAELLYTKIAVDQQIQNCDPGGDRRDVGCVEMERNSMVPVFFPV